MIEFSHQQVLEKKLKSSELKKYSLLALIICFAIAIYSIWQAWPSLIATSMQWQKQVNNELSELLYAAKNEGLTAGISLMLLSFFYGMLHSLGPGHGKLIVTTYIATQEAKVKLSLTLTLLSSIMQAVVAVMLVSGLLIVFNSSMREINSKAELLIPLSFCVVILLGLVIIWRNLVLMWRADRGYKKQQMAQIKAATKLTISAITPLSAQAGKPIFTQPFATTSKLNMGNEEHAPACSCGHQHVVDAQQINDASSFKEYLAIIVSIGIRPCTGAIMVLLFANMLGIYWLGIVSAFVMALGTALTTSIIALMTITGKQLVRRYLSAGKPNHKLSNKPNLAKFILPVCGGVVLVLLGILLLESRPVGMSPMF